MRRYIVVFLLSVLSISVQAQNINQSVQVTNDYEAQFADFQKAGVELTVPDSLYDFNYKFDYSVFDSPYKGAYEFTPYEIELKPEKFVREHKSFYLKAGAGYQLYPELDLVWTAIRNSKFALTVFNTGRGRMGTYGRTRNYTAFKGYDLADKFGVEGMLRLPKSNFSFNLGYDGIFTKPSYQTSAFHSPSLKLALKSLPSAETSIVYDINGSARLLYDNTSFSKLNGYYFSVAASFGMVWKEEISALLDLDLQSQTTSIGGISTNNNLLTVYPHAKGRKGIFDIELGVKIDMLFSDSTKITFAPMAKASLDIIPGSLTLFAGVRAGQAFNSYFNLKTLNHFYTNNLVSSGPGIGPTTRNKLDLFAGLKGSVAHRFQYNASLGYKKLEGMPMETLQQLGFMDINMVYGNLNMIWSSNDLDIKSDIRFSKALKVKTFDHTFSLPLVSGTLDVLWNRLHRIYAGISLQGASLRYCHTGVYSDIPAYLDLGLYGEYKLNQEWKLWGRVGNVLCMKIQRVVGFVEEGPYLSLGVKWNF